MTSKTPVVLYQNKRFDRTKRIDGTCKYERTRYSRHKQHRIMAKSLHLRWTRKKIEEVTRRMKVGACLTVCPTQRINQYCGSSFLYQ